MNKYEQRNSTELEHQNFDYDELPHYSEQKNLPNHITSFVQQLTHNAQIDTQEYDLNEFTFEENENYLDAKSDEEEFFDTSDSYTSYGEKTFCTSFQNNHKKVSGNIIM